MVEQAQNLKLTSLRALMKEQGIDVYLVFHNDAHSVSNLVFLFRRINTEYIQRITKSQKSSFFFLSIT